jgi:hypothetical protein
LQKVKGCLFKIRCKGEETIAFIQVTLPNVYCKLLPRFVTITPKANKSDYAGTIKILKLFMEKGKAETDCIFSSSILNLWGNTASWLLKPLSIPQKSGWSALETIMQKYKEMFLNVEQVMLIHF